MASAKQKAAQAKFAAMAKSKTKKPAAPKGNGKGK